LCFFTDGKKNKASELDMITLRNHAPRSYTTWLPVTLTWLPVTLTWLLNNLQLWRHRRGFQKLTVRFRPIRKEILSSMYNNARSQPLFFFINPFVWCTSRCRRRRGLLKLPNLKRSGNENVTHKPAMKKSISNSTAQSQGCLFAFFTTVAIKKCLAPYCFFFFCRRRREGQRVRLPNVCLQFLGKPI